MSDDIDLALRDILSGPARAPDDAFAQRMTRLVVAEERIRLARRAAWKRALTEAAAATALILAFVLLARTGPAPDSDGIVPLVSPASAGLLVLALWIAVSWRPAAGVFRA